MADDPQAQGEVQEEATDMAQRTGRGRGCSWRSVDGGKWGRRRRRRGCTRKSLLVSPRKRLPPGGWGGRLCPDVSRE